MPTGGSRTHNNPLKRRSNRILLSGYLFRFSFHTGTEETPADSLSFGVCPVPGLGYGGFEPLLIFFSERSNRCYISPVPRLFLRGCPRLTG